MTLGVKRRLQEETPPRFVTPAMGWFDPRRVSFTPPAPPERGQATRARRPAFLQTAAALTAALGGVAGQRRRMVCGSSRLRGAISGSQHDPTVRLPGPPPSGVVVHLVR